MINHEKKFTPIVPITDYYIYQAETEVDLIDFNVWTWNIENNQS